MTARKSWISSSRTVTTERSRCGSWSQASARFYARSEGLDWRPLVMTQLKSLGRKEDTSRRIDAKAQEIRTAPPGDRAVPAFCGVSNRRSESKATGKSRASFFRLLARHRPHDSITDTPERAVIKQPSHRSQ